MSVLEYLALSRSSKSLSGGSTAHPTSNTNWFTMVGVLYILDEPSIGLHQRDNDKLILFRNLRDIGNSLWWNMIKI
jgi:excinuclease ABC subunit A